ncbi:MAG: DUF1700 domain-containing protein [Ruminococcus sp.]|uniref:DUF1700 domain-containing protein n=1 Tax=Ruminococcus flavefaciens TaxID=1265 RepID=UPI001568086F|nr:DUF1700 domain-containing protein [Ruminococcus flavefaciens]MBR0511261.1 DUF1700 domain-containing protein [Ruminococcus sp.]
MNKLEFLTRLRNSLERGGMPAEDINDALTYYEEVFMDAGFGKEEETAASMGAPEEVAVNILRESGITPPPPPAPQNIAAAPQPQKKKPSGGAIAASIIIGVLTFPIWLPLLIAAVTILFVVIVVLLSLVFAFIAAGIGLIIGGFAILFEVPSVALMALGAGFIITGLVILLCKPVFRSAIPACGRGIKKLFAWVGGLFKKGGKENV